MSSKETSGEQYFTAEDTHGHSHTHSNTMINRWNSLSDKIPDTDDSLLEGENLPEFESPPLSPCSPCSPRSPCSPCSSDSKSLSFKDFTLPERSDWMGKVSDESFVALERLFSSPPPFDAARPAPALSVIQEVAGDSSGDYRSIDSSAPRSSTDCLTESADSGKDSFLSPSGARREKDVPEARESMECEKETSSNKSIKFNDTLEEMNFILEHGMNFQSEKRECPKLKEDEKLTPTMKPPKNPPLKKRFFFEGSPRDKENARPSPSKKNFFYSPLPSSKVKPLSVFPSGYDNVMSPIKFFIDNSPTVPRIKNVHPVTPIREKNLPEFDKTVLADVNRGPKISLPSKTYESSKNVRVIAQDEPGRLPKNGKVSSMVDNLPKTVVIKHEYSSPRRAPLSTESVAECDADMSVHIRKAASRTNTLK